MVNFIDVAERGVYFVLGQPNFHHLSICIAEGLKQLGIPIYANKTVWLINQETQEYLFTYNLNVHPNNCAICVADFSGLENLGWYHPMSDLITELDNELVLILLDGNDIELNFTGVERFNYIFRTHMINQISYPSNYAPWAFGISDRIKIATETDKPFSQKKAEIISVFRSSVNQGVRLAMEFCFLPHLHSKIQVHRELLINSENSADFNSFHQLYFSQIKTHHNPQYFETLKNSQFCCSYGGSFYYADLVERSKQNNLSTQQKPCILRWDSWRFWESLAAGCVSIHLDFDQYGFCLPIKPVNWEHYVGIDLANPKETAEKILDQPELMEKISVQGRQWALENYASIPVACRFLDLALGEDLGTTRNLMQSLDCL